MNFVFLTFTGCGLPLAYQLQQAGHHVIVGQVQDAKELKTAGWMGKEEPPEEKRRRLSIYDGLLEKTPADALLKRLQFIADKGRAADWFIVIDHNNLNLFGDKLAKMGFTG